MGSEWGTWVTLISKFKRIIYLMVGLSRMEKVAEGISDFGDFKAVLYRTSDDRHFVRIEPLDSAGKTHVEWLHGSDHLEWLRRWDHEPSIK